MVFIVNVDNIRAKIPLRVIIAGAGIGGLAAATVSHLII